MPRFWGRCRMWVIEGREPMAGGNPWSGEIVASFSRSPEQPDAEFSVLDSALAEARTPCTRVDFGAGQHIVIVPLRRVIDDTGLELTQGPPMPTISEGDNAVVVSEGLPDAVLDEVLGDRESGQPALQRVGWLLVSPTAIGEGALRGRLAAMGALTPQRVLAWKDGRGTFDLYQLSASSGGIRGALMKGADTKIAEGPDYLRGREEWFRKRHSK